MKITSDFAYWVGVVQTDGAYFTGPGNKRRKTQTVIHKVGLEVSNHSYEMLEKFLQISKKILGSKAKISHRVKTVNGQKFNAYGTCIGIKSIIPHISQMQINLKNTIPPNAFDSDELFGAYLAGVIDGDGSITNKNKKKGSMCVRIVSRNKPKELCESIQKILGCGCNYRKINGVNAYSLEFVIGYKNKYFLKKFVAQNMSILKKRDKILKRLSESEYRIELSDEAYGHLVNKKSKNESFSEAILRLLN